VNGTVTGAAFRGREADRLSMVAPTYREVARWLLDHEMASGAVADRDELATAIERICRTFFTRLARITSPAACQALLSRAVHIPRGEFVFLEEVRAASAGEPLIDGLRASLDGVDVVFARAGLEAVLGTLIDLLASFVGQDLTLSMLHKDWPGLLVVKPHSPPHLAGCGRMVDR